MGAMLFATLGFGQSVIPGPDEKSTPDLSASLAQRQPLVVGIARESLPYSDVTADGHPIGFLVELTEAVARVMQLRLRVVPVKGRELHERFRRGEFDLLESFSETPERAQFADFSVPYLTLQGRLYAQKRQSPIHVLTDFNDRPFAVVGIGSLAEKFLRDHQLHPKIVQAGTPEEGLRLVDSGACVGMFVSELTALNVIERAGLKNVAPWGEPLADYDIRYCFAVHAGDAQLLSRLNEGLAILHRTREFDAIYRRWFGESETTIGFSREKVVSIAAVTLLIGFCVALWGYFRQRALRHRIAGQAAQLAEKETLLQALYDNIPMAMCVLEATRDGPRVLAINRQAQTQLGGATRDAAGRPLASLAMDREWAAQLEELVRQWPKGEEFVREERELSGNRHIVFTLVPLVPGVRGEQRICVLAEDVSERRRLDEEIARGRKLRAVGELVGGIAHEFNNLLTPVMLKASEIEMDRAEDVSLQAEIKVIIQAVERAADLTRRLLTFGRRGEPRVTAVSLEATVANCFALLRQTVDRRIVWENAVSKELPPLQLNATDLNHILLNLVLNARDTLIEKLEQEPADWTPTIRVEGAMLDARASEFRSGDGRVALGWQELSVSDNGLGMTPAVRERIFEPFYTTKEVGKGTGLGLAVVWHLVTQIGGQVEVESHPGQGTTFRVLLPVWPASEAAATAATATPPAHAGPARIFIADDEQLVVGALKIALERAGHSVHCETDGARAWLYLEKKLGDFELLIFDVNMPGIDGIELARRVRAARYTGRILIVSGRATGLPPMNGARVDRVLAKPFTATEFIEAVDLCLRGAVRR